MDRAQVLAILGACTVGLASIVGLTLRRRHPFLLAWAAPVLAVLTSAALLTMGARSRTALVPTMTSLQLIEAAPKSGDLRVSSVVGAYHPQSTPTGVRGHGALMSPEAPPLAGSSGRVVWTDRDRWHLENVLLPAGVTIGRVSWNAAMDDRPFISATLTENGIEGKLESPSFQGGRDAIMVAPGAPHLAVMIDKKGAFSAGPDATLEPGQFVRSQLVDDRGNRRQQLYRELLAGGPQGLAVDGPALLFWTSALKSPVALGQTEREVGEALVLAPIALSRKRQGSSIAIPSLLIPWETVAGPDGTPVTSAYSNADRRWVEGLVAATNITMRFQMPTTTLPLKIQRATLYLVITAPSRDVSIVAWNGDQPIPLTTRSSPAGVRMVVTMDDSGATALDDRGGLLLNINVGRHPREQEANLAQSGWHIDRAWLDVNEAVVQPR
jgi:hypothetical protein